MILGLLAFVTSVIGVILFLFNVSSLVGIFIFIGGSLGLRSEERRGGKKCRSTL